MTRCLNIATYLYKLACIVPSWITDEFSMVCLLRVEYLTTSFVVFARQLTNWIRWDRLHFRNSSLSCLEVIYELNLANVKIFECIIFTFFKSNFLKKKPEWKLLQSYTDCLDSQSDCQDSPYSFSKFFSLFFSSKNVIWKR